VSGLLLVIVVGARFLVPLLTFRFPLPAILAALVIDAADQTVIDAILDRPFDAYQTYDKALDIHYLALAYLSTMRNWRNDLAFRVVRVLFLYRLVGVFLFEWTDSRWLLLVFPNTFEYAFIAYELVGTRWDPERLGRRAIIGSVAAIWIVVKLPQEWWIHIAQRDVTDTLADHPWTWSLLVAAVAAPILAVVAFRRRIPEPDHRLTFDVDRRQPPPGSQLPLEDGFFSAVLVEKIMLLTLIVQIFAFVLPDVEATDVGLVGGTVTLIVFNAAITQIVRSRRGRGWSSVAVEFGIVLAVNVGLVVLDAAIGDERVGDLPAGSTLFFVVLVSVFIALFDRYRLRRRAMLRRAARWRAMIESRRSRTSQVDGSRR